MSITLKTHKMLWGRSGNMCAFRDCKKTLVVDETETDNSSVIGEEAHIVAKKENGPRGQNELTQKQKDKYDNLVLLCSIHHKVIDDQPNEYTVEKIKELKHEHEKWVKENLTNDPQKMMDDKIYAGYVEKFIKLTGLHNWNISLLKGSDLNIVEGITGTEENRNGHPKGSFSGNTTAILGASSRTDSFGIDSTIVKWSIPLPLKAIMDFEKGYLVIASKRRFGGLHSKDYDGRTDIELNEKNIDSFGLRIIPQEHSDYFHRPPLPNNFPKIKPLNNCQTIYTWDLWNDRLAFLPFQELEIKIGRTVRWDIDYVGIIYSISESEPEVFISYDHRDKTQARKIAGDLNRVGIKSWIDEGQLDIGDSIIERISEGLGKVKYLIALISKNSITSDWVKKELSIAMTTEINSKKLQVFPLVLDNSKIPTYLTDKYYGDITTDDKYNGVINKIIMKIKTVPNKGYKI